MPSQFRRIRARQTVLRAPSVVRQSRSEGDGVAHSPDRAGDVGGNSLGVGSAIERELEFQLKANGVIPWKREHVFADPRKWRFDFSWQYMPCVMGNQIITQPIRLAVECEGGIWTGGAHSRGKGFTEDCEKYNEAALGGWMVLRVTGDQVKSGQALEWIERAFK